MDDHEVRKNTIAAGDSRLKGQRGGKMQGTLTHKTQDTGGTLVLHGGDVERADWRHFALALGKGIQCLTLLKRTYRMGRGARDMKNQAEKGEKKRTLSKKKRIIKRKGAALVEGFSPPQSFVSLAHSR